MTKTIEEQNTTLGSRIRSERENQGLTKSGLAQKVGISSTYLSKIEEEKSNPTIDVAGRIAKVLGISIEDIMGEVLTPEEIDKEIDEILETIHIAEEPNLANFDYEDKKEVLRMLRQIKEKYL